MRSRSFLSRAENRDENRGQILKIHVDEEERDAHSKRLLPDHRINGHKNTRDDERRRPDQPVETVKGRHVYLNQVDVGAIRHGAQNPKDEAVETSGGRR